MFFSDSLFVARRIAHLSIFASAFVVTPHAAKAQYVPFGSGCVGSSGAAPSLSSAMSPVIGSTCDVVVSNLPASLGDAVFMLTGVAATPGPIGLGPIGMPRCDLLIEPLAARAIPKVGTQATWSIRIGTSPSTVGFQFVNQAFVFDRALFGAPPNSFGAVVSNAATGTVLSTTLERSIVETFNSQSFFDTAVSASVWQNGTLTTGVIGDDGIHGDFDIGLLPLNANGEHVWDTDRLLVIPSGSTLLDRGDIAITDGLARFTRFEAPGGETLRIVGSHAPAIRVSGSAEICGRIEAGGEDASVAEQPWNRRGRLFRSGNFGVRR